MNAKANPSPFWYLVWLRRGPGLHALRQQLAPCHGRLLLLPPWRLITRQGSAALQTLERALTCPILIFTSPAAVTAANALLPLATHAPTACCIAVGSATAHALQTVGMHHVEHPQRMDSEGLLALPCLQNIDGKSIALITAPDGRGVIPATLQQRGAQLQVAEVYERRRVHLPARQRARLNRLHSHSMIVISSGKALQQLWQQLDDRQQRGLQQAKCVVASARLGQQAQEYGLTVHLQAASAHLPDLLEAIRPHLSPVPATACSASPQEGCLADGVPVLEGAVPQ